MSQNLSETTDFLVLSDLVGVDQLTIVIPTKNDNVSFLRQRPDLIRRQSINHHRPD